LATLVDLRGARVADLYAGSGAVGFEALSRGAAHALLVDRDPVAVRTLRRNAQSLELAGAEIVRGSVERVVDTTPGQSYDVVFLDPPYAISDADLDKVLSTLASGAWLVADGICVVERGRRRGPLHWPQAILPVRDRTYGEGTLWYGSRS
jgi:16S rRNA (guanine966-N2)-methyltransferase